MSTSDGGHVQSRYRLHVQAPEAGLGVLVIDSQGSIVGRCRDEESDLELDLPRGLYTIRTHRCGNFFEWPIRLDSAQTINVPAPAVFTAAPIPGASTTHEYYTYPAWEVSFTPTAPAQEWNGPVNSGLLLFVRASEASQYRDEDQFAGLSLRTLDGSTLSTFEQGHARRGPMGWSAFSAHGSSGLLILEDSGEEPRQIPVPLLPGWQTQIFAMHRGRLLWEDMRLHLVSADDLRDRARPPRSPYDFQSEDLRTAPTMDVGLLALQNDTPSLWPQLVDPFLSSEEKNPLLGLLGAYLMLLQNSCSLLGSDRGPAPPANRVSEVLDQLHRLIPDSADLVALRLLARDLVPGAPVQAPVEALPWFRLGAETLLKEHDQQPERGLLAKGSLLLALRHRLLGDCVWTTWEPIALPPVEDSTPSSAPEASGPGPADRTVMKFVTSVEAVSPRAMPSAAAPRETSERPSLPLVYERLSSVLADFASPDMDQPSAETPLTDLVPPDDRDGLFWLSRRIARRFRDFHVLLSEAELASAVTVGDLAQMIVDKDV